MTIRPLALAAALLAFPLLSPLLSPLLFSAALAQAPRPARAQRPPAPAADMVTEATLSRDALRAAYTAAKLPNALDQGGNLTVRAGDVTLYVLPAKDSIRLLVSYAFVPRAALPERLDLANRINDGYIAVRATIAADKPGEITIDHYILLGAGISRATILAVTRRFADIMREAITATDTERLLK
ncbi:MAG: YbjN domain-containing protein [Acetobacteraceae bacterium]|nr:YbjN domain-containing protein [Acetobacteraceae bacterium]